MSSIAQRLPFSPRLRHGFSRVLLLSGLLVVSLGCSNSEANRSGAGRPGGGDGPVAVETVSVQTGSLGEALNYTGTTQPVRRVTVRSQAEGQVMGLAVDVGDALGQGDVIARLDGALLTTGVNEARSELSARQSEVAQAQAAVSDAQTALELARAQVQQAEIDAQRLRQLANEGAVSQQEAEQAQLALEGARQVLRSSQEQVRTRELAVVAAQGRVSSQQAVVDESQQRLSYTSVRSPFAGVVLTRLVSLGDYVQVGAELMELGDLSQIEVAVELSELDLDRVSLGQPVEVTLDAFPGQSFPGRVTRIAPAADTTARLIPVTVTLDNPGGRIGSGLLARVSFAPSGAARVVVPDLALQVAPEAENPTVFVLQDADAPVVEARPVQVGDRANGQVEILSGINPGEALVVRSDRPLEDGQSVRLSILSEVEGSESAN